MMAAVARLGAAVRPAAAGQQAPVAAAVKAESAA
jgi:hypothetical protein